MPNFESSLFGKSLFTKRRDCDYSPHLKNVVIDTKSVNCEVTSRLLSISTCYSRRPGSLQADAFRGHGFSLLEKTTLRGLQTRAIPAGVTALHLPALVRLTENNLLLATAIPATRIHEDSCGRKGIGGTPQCVSTRRPTSRPRKA